MTGYIRGRENMLAALHKLPESIREIVTERFLQYANANVCELDVVAMVVSLFLINHPQLKAYIRVNYLGLVDILIEDEGVNYQAKQTLALIFAPVY